MNYLAPFALRNGHTQTLMAHLLAGPAPTLPAERHRIVLADGDAQVLHDSIPTGWCPGAPVAVIVHGLTGSHKSPMVARIARKLYSQGIRVGRIDLRGAGAGFSLARKLYHVGRSDDLGAACQLLANSSPGSPMLLVGLSLGANIVLKLAAENAGVKLPLAGVWVACPPVNPGLCVAKLERQTGRIYDRNFVKALVSDWRARKQLFPDLPDLFLKPSMSLRDYDAAVTAPINGYRDVEHYYDANTTTHLIPTIKTPTTIVACEDDPVVDVGPLRDLQIQLGKDHPTRIVLNRHGGHLGFLDMRVGGLRSRVDDAVALWAKEILGPPPYCTSTNCQRQTP